MFVAVFVNNMMYASHKKIAVAGACAVILTSSLLGNVYVFERWMQKRARERTMHVLCEAVEEHKALTKLAEPYLGWHSLGDKTITVPTYSPLGHTAVKMYDENTQRIANLRAVLREYYED